MFQIITYVINIDYLFIHLFSRFYLYNLKIVRNLLQQKDVTCINLYKSNNKYSASPYTSIIFQGLWATIGVKYLEGKLASCWKVVKTKCVSVGLKLLILVNFTIYY